MKDEIHFLVNEFEANFYKNFDKKKLLLTLDNIFLVLRRKKSARNYKFFLNELQNYSKNYLLNNFEDYDENYKFKKNNSFNKQKYLISYLRRDLVDEILKISEKKIKILNKNIENNKTDRSDLTFSGGFTVRKIIYLLNKELKQNSHLETVSNYLGYNSHVTKLAIEQSTDKSTWWKNNYKSKASKKTLYAHLDKEFASVKSILYLTDVNKNNGPFTVYPKIYENLKLNLVQNIFGRVMLSCLNTNHNILKEYYNVKDKYKINSNLKFMKHYDNLPTILKFNNHFGWTVKHNSNLEKKILDKEKCILGPAGTLITFDGSKLLHRGGLIKKDKRLVLQIIYEKKRNLILSLYSKLKKRIIKRPYEI